MGAGKEVQINIEEKAVTVRDFGRGIPLGKVIECVSQINTSPRILTILRDSRRITSISRGSLPVWRPNEMLWADGSMLLNLTIKIRIHSMVRCGRSESKLVFSSEAFWTVSFSG